MNRTTDSAIVPFPAQGINYRDIPTIQSARIGEWPKPRESEFISRATVMHLRLPTMAKLLLIILRAFQCPDTGRCEPSVMQLARSCGCGKSSVLRARAILKRKEIIEWVSHGSVCCYRFTPKSISTVTVGSIGEQGVSTG